MIHNFFSVKGGVGTTTVACAFALSIDEPTTLIDAAPNSDAKGVLAVTSDDCEVTNNLRYLRLPEVGQDDVRNLTGRIVIDWGTQEPQVDGKNILVSTLCYLSLRNATIKSPKIDGAILRSEEGRALSEKDVYSVLGKPILCMVRTDPVVARAVDAGMLPTRLPTILNPIRNLTRKAAGV